MNYKIAIDGPSGTGKSTTAKTLAKELSFIYIDTGAMYRSVALYCYKNDIDVNDVDQVSKVLNNINIELFYENGEQKVKLNGEDVSAAIRENIISQYASIVSTHSVVREKMVLMQQELASKNSVIMDGRDIGTVVLPDADLKIYLVAATEVRADRRYKELIEKGQEVTLEEVISDIEERDYRDTHRESSPLKQADDAILLDSSNMTKEEVVKEIKRLFNEKVGNKQ